MLYRKILLAAALSPGFLFFARHARADGFAYVYDRDMFYSWKQHKQFGAVSLRDGVQRLIIGINPADPPKGDSAVWIFPVPAAPETARIAILDEFPVLVGRDVAVSARRGIDQAVEMLLATQIYPVCLMMDGFSRMGWYEASDLRVYSRVEGFGLVSELVSTRSAAGLAEHLGAKGIRLADSVMPLLDEYSGMDYSFVISWIGDLDEFTASEHGRDTGSLLLGIQVSFPSERLFYPLKLTSAYGDVNLPISLYAVDWVERCDGFAGPAVRYRYFESYGLEYGDGLMDFYSGAEQYRSLKYTKIEIASAASGLDADLWLSPGAPAWVGKALWVEKNAALFMLVFLLVAGPIAGGVAGFALYRGNPAWKALIPAGLANAFTIAGVAYAVSLVRTIPFSRGMEDELRKQGLQAAGVKWWRYLMLAALDLGLIFFALTDPELFPYLFFFSLVLIALGGLRLCSGDTVVTEKIAGDKGAGATIETSLRVYDLRKLAILTLPNVLVPLIAAIFLGPNTRGYVSFENDLLFYVIATVTFAATLIGLAVFELMASPLMGWRGIRAVPKDSKKYLFLALNSIVFVVVVVALGASVRAAI